MGNNADTDCYLRDAATFGVRFDVEWPAYDGLKREFTEGVTFESLNLPVDGNQRIEGARYLGI